MPALGGLKLALCVCSLPSRGSREGRRMWEETDPRTPLLRELLRWAPCACPVRPRSDN